MRIGIFTDTYRPSTNGIVYVAESLKKGLESLGHEVYVFCPARRILPSKDAVLEREENHVIRFPSFSSRIFDEFDMSVFFPPLVLVQISSLQLDVVHILTPSQIGLMGVNVAWHDDIPFVIQHCTDLYEFVEHYPNALPGSLAVVSLLLPYTVRLQGHDTSELLKLYRPRLGRTRWNRLIIEKTITILYSKADAVIALCRKTVTQLSSWQDDKYRYDLTLLPNGVDPLPEATPKQVATFRKRHGIRDGDLVFGFVGRLAEEKNLPFLIQVMDEIGEQFPQAKLLFVGDFSYRKTLEALAAVSYYPDKIIFTGRIPREKLGVAYAAMDVFTFPSLKDTQGWVLHEAAHAGLPIMLLDKGLSEVVRHGKNGYIIPSCDPVKFAAKLSELFADKSKREEFSLLSKRLAGRYTEAVQIQKLAVLYQKLIAEYVPRQRRNNEWRVPS